MKKYLEMFIAFFKIGAFTIGGGYAMLPLIEKEVVDRKRWIEREEYLDMIALAQSAPGPIAVNTSVFVGYKVGGVLGVFATTLGSVLPSFLIILIIASFFTGIKDNVFVEKAFKGIRPAVVALIAAPVINMSKSAKINRKTILIPIVVTILVAFANITPIIIIIVSALSGVFYMRHIGGNKE
ncbi:MULTISPECIES: chromate transporter [Clostridium]|jgi:chromate transporter|uniref:Putative chromate transport protein n=2 Tax=Clostridium TaxID=1485 RepID=A0A151ANY5_9CLOT|nr:MULTISPECIES: chromate transporter [Clostridium]KYH29342.1 putative chromate transport protein [Clostridium colicanis DSM 13634]MBE6043130.1 chromate transporter [Clostridium thermopalmarium]PRR70944.1 putative chromate transport protein [Clostridium thermopalmarium DSM 5974]PVZ28867.1 chromate transporter [Clostridium thermopalmarium DSM 5974]